MTKKLFLLVLTLQTIKFSASENPLVLLPNGQIQGRTATTHANKTFFAFEKVPYAAPPVGSLRFQPPQPPANWDGILNTTYLDVGCYGLKNHVAPESEDCLYLNVYTSKLPSNEDEGLLPVMLFIHGGAFLMGWAIEFAKPDLFIDNGVVFVTINYRLGPFGFISTQDDVIPGNNGLKDQLLALQWTHDNIHLFGGDPDKVTIFGQSAGAGSCAYHLLNPNSLGLFSGVILESGSFLSPGMYQRDSRKIAFGTAAVLNSTFKTSEDSALLLQFLQTIDAEELNAAAEEYVYLNTFLWNKIVDQGSPWAPVIEVKNPNAFITKKMYGLLKAGNILPIPTMMGINSEEILFSVQSPNLTKSIMQLLDQNLDNIVPNDMQISDSQNHTKMGYLIREIYTGGEAFVDHIGAGVRYGSDNLLTRPLIKHAEMFSKFGPTYFYQFSYDGPMGNISVVYDDADRVGHTEEMLYLFCSGLSCNDNTYSEKDLLTRQRLIKLWTDFAKYQDPTPEPSELLQNITWPQLNVDHGDFLYLDIDGNLEVKNHPKEMTYKKWVELYDSLGFDDFDSY